MSPMATGRAVPDNDERDDRGRAGADGLADADLARALSDGKRNETVDAHHREDCAERAKAARHRGAGLCGHERWTQRVGHRLDVGVERRIQPPDIGAERLGGGGQVRGA